MVAMDGLEPLPGPFSAWHRGADCADRLDPPHVIGLT